MIPIGDDNSANTIRPYVNYILIAANILVFILFQSMGSNQAFVMSFSTVPQEIITGSDIVGGPAGLLPTPIPVLGTIFTAMFMHGSIAHIAGNMLYLWIFGDNLENRMGHAKYLAFYLILRNFGNPCSCICFASFGQGYVDTKPWRFWCNFRRTGRLPYTFSPKQGKSNCIKYYY